MQEEKARLLLPSSGELALLQVALQSLETSDGLARAPGLRRGRVYMCVEGRGMKAGGKCQKGSKEEHLRVTEVKFKGASASPLPEYPCVSGVGSFLLYSVHEGIRGIPLDPNDKSDALVPVSGTSLAVGIDFHAGEPSDGPREWGIAFGCGVLQGSQLEEKAPTRAAPAPLCLPFQVPWPLALTHVYPDPV